MSGEHQTSGAFAIPPPKVENQRQTDMNSIGPAQRQFLRELQDNPDTLERIVQRMKMQPWRLSAWMRRPGFQRALHHVLKGLRRKRNLELELAAAVGLARISRLAREEKSDRVQLEAACAAVELSYRFVYPPTRRRSKWPGKKIPPPQNTLLPPGVSEEEALVHIRALEAREPAD
jgi:hypothetical protein